MGNNYWGKKQADPVGSFARSSVAFLDGVSHAANTPRIKTVALVSNSDGAIPAGEGASSEHIVPMCITNGVMYGVGFVASGGGAGSFDLYSSLDGVTWTVVGSDDNNGMVYATSKGTLLWINSDDRKMYRSANAGVSFTEIVSPNWAPSAGSTWNTPWMFAEHEGVLMLAEYGAASELSGPHLYKSTDDGLTWSVTYDLDSQTAKPYHWHTVAYHAGTGKDTGRWVAAFGDSRPLRGIVTSQDGINWHKLYTEGTCPDQPVCFYDYGHPTKILYGADGGTCIGRLDVITGEIEVLFAKTDRLGNRGYCWVITKVGDVYYAGSHDTSTSGAEQAVLWVSTDLINWSVYHRFTTGEALGFYRYAGYLGGKLHFDIQAAGGRKHFAISPATVKNVNGVLCEPAATNLKTTTSSSSNEVTSDWASGSVNWTVSQNTTTALHGSACAKCVGTDGSAGTKNAYASNITLGNASVPKTYIISFYAKTDPGKNEVGQANLRTSAGVNLTPDVPAQFVLDSNWQKITLPPVTIAAAAPAAHRVYVTITQGTTAATIYLDCLQIQESPVTEWQVGGTAKTADNLTETVGAAYAWSHLFAVQAKGLDTQYANAKQYLDHADVVDKTGGLVGIACTGHGYADGSSVTIIGTTNYNGVWTLHADSSANELVITATYAAEHIPLSTAQVAQTVTQHLKTWKVGSDELLLYYNVTNRKFYIQRNAETAVASLAQKWNPNAIIKLALRVDASGLTLDIQNGRAIEQITDSALAAIINASLTIITGDLSSENQFPGVYVGRTNLTGLTGLTALPSEMGFGFIPFKLTDAEVAEAFNLAPTVAVILPA
jgi:hypothetical protein